jgi:hypothetical protein
MSRLRDFYTDKELKKEVFDHIFFHAKERLIEAATKKESTDWFSPLLDVLLDSDRKLDEMFEVKQDKKIINRAK